MWKMLYFWKEDNFMKQRIIACLLLCAIALSCERDDICDSDNTTPRLVLAFYNIENPEDLTKYDLSIIIENDEIVDLCTSMLDRLQNTKAAFDYIEKRVNSNDSKLVSKLHS